MRPPTPDAKVVHVVPDNYRVHGSRIAKAAAAGPGGGGWCCTSCRRTAPTTTGSSGCGWTHANVTRDHRHGDTEELTRDVIARLAARDRRKGAELRAMAPAARAAD